MRRKERMNMSNPSLRRRGNAMIYTIIVLPALFGVISLAVDLGRVQVIKSELQRAADATARGYLNIRIEYGDAIAQQYGPYIPGLNPVDSNSGVSPTTTITRGYWNAQTKTFTAGTGSPFAIRVVMSRKAAQDNAVPLIWGGLIGKSAADVEAEAIGLLTSASVSTSTVSAQSDPWLAGMPAGSTASYNDVAGNASGTTDAERKQSAKQLSIPVVPGSIITFESILGQVRHGPTLEDYNPDGKPQIYSHGADSPGGATPAAENGIGDVKMPINAFLGLFLDDSQPNSTAAPTDIRDYSTASSRDQTQYSDIQRKQPFFIGDGQTSGGVRQSFRVPEGATRLFVGIMDGHEWSNNQGSFSVTTRVKESVSLVR
jgi:Flp pilus assembly protein TadG